MPGLKQHFQDTGKSLLEVDYLIAQQCDNYLAKNCFPYNQEIYSKIYQSRIHKGRLSTLLNMNKILVFHQGHIIEQGSHQELLEQGGHYAKLWRMQADGFMPLHEV